ncbi:MAG: hypothetical protein IJ125_02270 [Atopobiaceae bacterium]|nr:hypothetical protein [Atopobiaceae bacterium]
MTSYALKIVAMLTMLIDHCTSAFGWPQVGHVIGRIAFPLYAYMLVDSYQHVKNDESRLKRYLFDLAIMAIISEFPYDFIRTHSWISLSSQNQILQFLVIVLALMTFDWLSGMTKDDDKGDLMFNIFFWIAVATINEVLSLGYGASGVVLVLLFRYYFNKHGGTSPSARLLSAIFVMSVYLMSKILLNYFPAYITLLERGLLPSTAQDVLLTSFMTTLGCHLAIPFLALHNGSYGNIARPVHIFYRWFYPLHLFVLAAILLFASML